jgi:hypothetical protein
MQIAVRFVDRERAYVLVRLARLARLVLFPMLLPLLMSGVE